MLRFREAHLRAAALVREAGGKLVGRTRLQKISYLMQLAGYPGGFEFEYRHYGPFSEDLAEAIEIASGLGLVEEEVRRAEWGGKYSVYRATDRTPLSEDNGRARFAATAAEIGAIELELAATAAFLYADEGIGREGNGDPWAETAKRKPDKADQGRLDRARTAYSRLRGLPTPKPLPEI